MTSSDDSVWPTRRRFLSLVAGGVAGPLAGCGSLDGSDGSNVKNSTAVIGHGFPHDPSNYQLNPWALGYLPGFPSVLFEPLSVDVHGGDRELTDLVADFTVNGRTATIEFSEAFSWWNGEPVTARDRWVAHRIDDRLGVTHPWDSVTLVDDYTLEYTFEALLRDRIAARTVVGTLLDTPAWLFDDWRAQLADADSENERRQIAEDLQTTALSPERAMEEGYGCGPYELSEVSVNRMLFERYDDHPNADAVSVPELWFPIAEGRRAEELTRDGVLDVGEGVPGGSRNADLPEYVEQLASYRTDFGTKYSFNFAARHLGRRGVRRAFLCALPLDGLVGNAGWGTPMALQTGLSPDAADRWLGPVADRLHTTPVERDIDRAHEFLRSAGYDRQGGDWVGPEGEPLAIRLRAPRWEEWGLFGQQTRSALLEAGFDITLDTGGLTTYGTKLESNSYDVIGWWTQGDPFYAYDVFDESLVGLGFDVTDPQRSRTDRDKPVEVTIPSEPGRLEVEGDGVTINLVDLWDELRRPVSADRTREIVRLFARWWNYDLPDLHLATWDKRVWGNTRDFDWPDEGADIYRHVGPQNRVDYNLIRTGAIESTE